MELSVKKKFDFSLYLSVFLINLSFITVSRFVPLDDSLSLLLRSTSFALNIFLSVLLLTQLIKGQERSSFKIAIRLIMPSIMCAFALVLVTRYYLLGGSELRFLPIFFVFFSAIIIRDLFLLYPTVSRKITLVFGYFFLIYISLKIFNASDSRLHDVLPNHSRNHLSSVALFFISTVSILNLKGGETLLGNMLTIMFSLIMVFFTGTSGTISGILILLAVARLPFKLFVYLVLTCLSAVAIDFFYGSYGLFSAAQHFYLTDPRSQIWTYWFENLTFQSFIIGNSSELIAGYHYTLHNSFFLLFDWSGVLGITLFLLSFIYIFISGEDSFKFLCLAFMFKFTTDTVFRSYDLWLAYNLIFLFVIRNGCKIRWKF